MTSGNVAALFLSVNLMPFLAPTLDNADPLFALVITPDFYQQNVEVTDQDPASCSLFKQARNSYE